MVKLLDSIYKLTKVCPVSVIPQVRTITRYGTGSVILFNCAESPVETISVGDSVQTGSHDMFLSRFALSYGMTQRTRTEVLCVNTYIVAKLFELNGFIFHFHSNILRLNVCSKDYLKSASNAKHLKNKPLT